MVMIQRIEEPRHPLATLRIRNDQTSFGTLRAYQTNTGSGSLGSGSSSISDGPLFCTVPTASPTGRVASGGVVDLQQVGRVTDRRVQPRVPGLLRQHERHAVVDRGHGSDAGRVTTVVDISQRSGSVSLAAGLRQNS